MLPKLIALSVLFVSACSYSQDIDLGGGRDGGRVDAATRPDRTDECGNGLDDDQNGRIDDGCPCGHGESQSCFSADYPSRGVGACENGTQVCSARGTEWGDWGDAPCEGEVVPAEESCDGQDIDCDGAVDEDCPCTDGEELACGEEFVIEPCRPGTQTCRAGTWSGCEGAIEPSAELCDDGIDNDCDGMVDDALLCACVPVPEICANGIDDDCDGAADEDACTPDWATDAGVDAGLLDAGPRRCNGRTNLCLSRPGTLETTPAIGTTRGDGFGPQLAMAGTRLLVMEAQMVGTVHEPSDLHFLVLAADGTIEHDVLVETDVARVGDIVWTGTEAALVWWGGAPGHQLMYALLRLDGTTATGPTPIDAAGVFFGGTVQAAAGPDGLAFAWARYPRLGGFEVSSGWFQRRNADGSPGGPLVELGTAVDPTSMEAFGSGFVVGARRYLGSSASSPSFPQFQSQVHHVAGDAVTWSVDLPLDAYSRSSGAVIAASCDRVLACWQDLVTDGTAARGPHVERCQVFDAAGIAVGAAPTVVFAGTREGGLTNAHYLDVVWADGQFLVRDEATSDGSLLPLEWYAALSSEGSVLWTEHTDLARK